MTIPNPLLKENKFKKSQVSQPLQQKCFSQKWIQIQRAQNDCLENRYKDLDNNLARNTSYNSIGNKINRKTYSMTTGDSNNSDSPNYSTNLNKPIIIPKSYFLNQETPKYPFYSFFEKIKQYPKFNNNINNSPLAPTKNIARTQRNKSHKILVSSKPINYYQPFQQNYLDSQKDKYIFQASRNIYSDPSKKQYQNIEFNNSNYLNFLENKPQAAREFKIDSIPSTPRQIYATYHPNYNQTNPQLVKSQLSNSYQFQRSPNFPNRNILNFHNRFNSYQMLDSFNDFDNLEEDQFISENDDLYNTDPKYRDILLDQNKGKIKDPNDKNQKYIIVKKTVK